MAETFLMALGVLAIVILIVMVAPIVIFLKREDYKNLADIFYRSLRFYQRWRFYHNPDCRNRHADGRLEGVI